MTNKGSSDRTKLITKVGSCQVSWLWWLQNMLPKFFDIPTMDRASRSLSLNLGPVMNWLPEQWQKSVMPQFPSTGLDLLSLGTGILGLNAVKKPEQPVERPLWRGMRSLAVSPSWAPSQQQCQLTNRLPRRLSSEESACQCRRHGFEPWSGKIPHGAEHLGPEPLLLGLCSRARELQVLCPRATATEVWAP